MLVVGSTFTGFVFGRVLGRVVASVLAAGFVLAGLVLAFSSCLYSGVGSRLKLCELSVAHNKHAAITKAILLSKYLLLYIYSSI
jgi:hypothetical protein